MCITHSPLKRQPITSLPHSFSLHVPGQFYTLVICVYFTWHWTYYFVAIFFSIDRSFLFILICCVMNAIVWRLLVFFCFVLYSLRLHNNLITMYRIGIYWILCSVYWISTFMIDLSVGSWNWFYLRIKSTTNTISYSVMTLNSISTLFRHFHGEIVTERFSFEKAFLSILLFLYFGTDLRSIYSSWH